MSGYSGLSAAGRDIVFRPKDERQTMKLKVDREVDALYLTLDESDMVELEEVSPGIIVDYNANLTR